MAIDIHKKIIFELQQGDGYPPVKYEKLWAVPLQNGSYSIDSIPFYVMGISAEDEVEADDVDGELYFKRLVQPSGISTFRLFLADPATSAQVRARLETLGCKSEYNQHIGLVAVEVPTQTRIQPFFDYIVSERANGAMDIEEGALRHQLSSN